MKNTFGLLTLAVSAVLLIISCDTSLDTLDFYPFDFTGQISCSFGTAVIKPDMSLWFINDDHKDGHFIPADNAIKYDKISSPISIELVEGMYFAAGIHGNIFYWGFPMYSSTMVHIVEEPTVIGRLHGVKAIDDCYNKINMLRNDGTLWQANFNYSNPTQNLHIEQVPGLEKIVKISNGFALKEDGTLYELEYSEPDYGGYVGSIYDVIDIENTLNRRTYVVKKDGTVWGWGRNDYGELCDGSLESKTNPVQVKGLSGIIKISCNYDYNLALKKDGTVWYWGYTGRDENNNPKTTPEPVKVEGIKNVVLFEASMNSFFMKNDGSVWYYNVLTKQSGKILFN